MTTIRRDLDSLEALGCLTRTHGGATAVHVEDELPFHSKMSSYLPEKRAIGVKTASLIPDGAVIGCSGGTTVMQVIKALKDKNLMVVTNAVNVAMELASTESVQVIVTGGNLRARTFELVGPHCRPGPRILPPRYRSPWGGRHHGEARTLDLHGCRCPYGLAVHCRHAEETWVVADHSKIGRVTPALVSPLNRVKRLITDPRHPGSGSSQPGKPWDRSDPGRVVGVSAGGFSSDLRSRDRRESE